MSVVVAAFSEEDNAVSLARDVTAAPIVRALRWSSNFGHQLALLSGMGAVARGAVITTDANLQHPHELLPDLIARWREGFEIAKTERPPGLGEAPFKRWTSAIFYRVFSFLSGVPPRDGIVGFPALGPEGAR